MSTHTGAEFSVFHEDKSHTDQTNPGALTGNPEEMEEGHPAEHWVGGCESGGGVGGVTGCAEVAS